MERAVSVATHEDDGEQVERPAEVALDAKSRLAVQARTMVHRNLGDGEAEMMSEYGYEAMPLAVELDILEHLGAVGLQAAVHIVQENAGRPARRCVIDVGDHPPNERVLAVTLPAGDEVVALVELRDEGGDFRRIVLEVGVHRHDDLARCSIEACRQGGRLSEVATQADDS